VCNGKALRWMRSAAALVGAVGLCLALPACEPPAPEALLGPAQETTPFEVVGHEIDDSGAVTVHFSRPLDSSSVGSRSVRLLNARGRIATRARVEGDTLHVRPTGARRRARRKLVLRLEGDPSPRALRSVDGAFLPARVEIDLTPSLRPGGDLTRPDLLASSPEDGEVDIAPSTSFMLTFSEPLDRGAVRAGRAVTVFADGARVPARLRLSSDRSMLVVRPRAPLPAGSAVIVRVEPALLDLAGNPVARKEVRFEVRTASFRAVREEFVGQEMADLSGTSCSWCGPSAPGFLVWASGRRALGPRIDGATTLDLGDRRRVRFQVILAPDDPAGSSFASAVRLFFDTRDAFEGVRGAIVDAGTTDLVSVEPTFASNRALTRLLPFPVAHISTALDVTPFGEGSGVVEIPFEQPLPVAPGESVLIDVELELAPGVRLLAVPDDQDQALVDGASGRLLLPAVQLLVSGGAPRARSRWYDTGESRPRWRRASVTADPGTVGVDARFEYQTAPAFGDGSPDLDRASPWSADLADLPPHRFVRFRARFMGSPNPQDLPRIDRLVMPFESR